MKKKFLLVGICILPIIIVLSGCTSTTSEKDKFIGTWKSTLSSPTENWTMSLTFFTDGRIDITMGNSSGNGNWDLQDGN